MLFWEGLPGYLNQTALNASKVRRILGWGSRVERENVARALVMSIIMSVWQSSINMCQRSSAYTRMLSKSCEKWARPVVSRLVVKRSTRVMREFDAVGTCVFMSV